VGCDPVPFGGMGVQDVSSKRAAFVLDVKAVQLLYELLDHEDGGSPYRRNLKSHLSKHFTSHAIRPDVLLSLWPAAII
jgi:hypothetical protein